MKNMEYKEKLINATDLELIHLLKNTKIQNLPFLIDLWIGANVPIHNIEYIYYPNLEIYKINIKLEDIIQDKFIVKTITTDINGNILERSF